MKTKLAEVSPVAGGVNCPLRYFQERRLIHVPFSAGADEEYIPTQSVLLAGPLETETLTAAPPDTEVGEAEMVETVGTHAFFSR